MGEPALDAVLAPENDGLALVASPQQVLREIEARLREPLRAGHARGVNEHRARAAALHRAEVPQQVPELLGPLDGPGVELGVGVASGARHETRELGRGGALGSGRPQRRQLSNERILSGMRTGRCACMSMKTTVAAPSA